MILLANYWHTNNEIQKIINLNNQTTLETKKEIETLKSHFK
jgi:hypothetical protein